MTRRGSGEVLPMTLTEILVLLFFILALALAWQIQRYRNVPPEAAEAIDNVVRAGVQLPPADGWTEIFICLEEASTRGGDEPPCSEALAQARRDLAGVASAFGIDTAGVTTTEMADSLRRQVADAKALAADAVRDLGGEADAVQTASLRDLIIILRARGTHPPCWWQLVDQRQRIVFALDVVLRTDDITVRRRWPDVYDPKARQVTNLVELSNAGRISYDEFRELALPVLRWGQEQNPQCRHFVVVHDSVRGGEDEKEDFKEALLTVESFFYKYLAN